MVSFRYKFRTYTSPHHRTFSRPRVPVTDKGEAHGITLSPRRRSISKLPTVASPSPLLTHPRAARHRLPRRHAGEGEGWRRETRRTAPDPRRVAPGRRRLKRRPRTAPACSAHGSGRPPRWPGGTRSPSSSRRSSSRTHPSASPAARGGPPPLHHPPAVAADPARGAYSFIPRNARNPLSFSWLVS